MALKSNTKRGKTTIGLTEEGVRQIVREEVPRIVRRNPLVDFRVKKSDFSPKPVRPKGHPPSKKDSVKMPVPEPVVNKKA